MLEGKHWGDSPIGGKHMGLTHFFPLGSKEQRETIKKISSWMDYRILGTNSKMICRNRETYFILLHVLKVRGRKKRERTFILCQLCARHSACTFNFTHLKFRGIVVGFYNPLIPYEEARFRVVKLPKVTHEAAELDQPCLPATHKASQHLWLPWYFYRSRNRASNICFDMSFLRIFRD